MKQIRTAGLILGAIFAMSAFAAATASAAPTVPAIVNSKGEELVKKKYTSSSGASTLETVKNGAIKCKASTDSGEITGRRTGTSTVTFTGCESASIKCNTAKAKSGEIITKASSEVVFLSESAKTVGLDLTAEEKTVECSILQKLKVRGSVIGVITAPKNEEASETFTLSFKQKKGVQEPTEYEEEAKKIKDITETEGSGIKTFAFEQSGLESTDTLKFEEKAKIEP